MSHQFTKTTLQTIRKGINRMDIQINGDTRIETIILNEIADIDLQIFRKGTARKCVKLPFEIITK